MNKYNSDTVNSYNSNTGESYNSDTVRPNLNIACPTANIDRNMTATKNNAGRKGYEYENCMEKYRKWFTSGKDRTRKRNAVKLKAYCDWIDKTPQQLLQEYIEARKDVNALNDWKRNTRQKIVEYYNFLKAKGYKINYCRTMPLGILAFYSAHAETIKDVTKEFDAVQIPENEYAFSQDDLRKMFYYGDTEEKAMLSSAVSLGYSSIDFLEMETEKYRNIIREARDKKLDIIGFIGKTRAKTSIQPRSFLTTEAIDSLEEYITLLEKKYGKLPRYVWSNSSETSHITNQGLNKKLKRIVEKANVKTYGKQVKFHCIRKFLYTRLSHKDRDIAKVITGKKVNVSDLTYDQGLDAECERIFRETYKEICLNGDVTGKTRKTLEETIEKQNKRIEELETFNRLLQQFYTEDIIKRAREALAQGKMTKEQFSEMLRKLTKQQEQT